MPSLLLTSPHSGETIPPEAAWLEKIDPQTLLTDVDRFVDQLYGPACQALGLPLLSMDIHRYVLDLNRLPADDETAGFASGFHWSKTTLGHTLLERPLPQELHERIVSLYYEPFHRKFGELEKQRIASHGLPRYHLDVHSMPSMGKIAHKDAGRKRPDIVVSDCDGKSCSAAFKDLLLEAFRKQGFNVSYNWPYSGGRMTEQYGKPGENRHSAQIELNRALYMDETTKEKALRFAETQSRIHAALERIAQRLR